MIVLLFIFLCCAGTFAESSYSFVDDVQPILQSRCLKCHGPDKQKGDIRLDTLSTDFATNPAAAETWHDASNLIMRGEMPPEDARELSDEQRKVLLAWMERNLHDAIAGGVRFSEGSVIRRLNREAYQYAMTDLLGFEMDYAGEFPADARSPEGYRNNGAALDMTALQLENYFKSARQALGFVLVDGEQPERAVEALKLKGDKLRGREYIGVSSDRLGRTNFWNASFKDLPKSGPFTIRITARAERGEGQGAPVLRARYGYFVAGLTINIMEDAGTIEIPSTESAVYEITGRSEFMPAPEMHVPADRVNGIITLQNVLADGGPPPKQVAVITEEVKNGKTRKKKTKRFAEDPNYPKVIIESVEFIRNDYPSWPPPLHTRIIPDGTDLDSIVDLSQVLAGFLRRAWRRPVTDTELTEWLTHFQEIRRDGSPIEAMRETLAAALASTDFLFLSEPVGEGESRPLTSHELAARLALFLWSSVPDADLRAAADKGALLQPATLRAEFARLLADVRSDRFAEQFGSQWLDLDGVDRVAIDPQVYRNFDNEIKPHMVGETIAFFKEILRDGSSAMQFLDADFTMLNAALAKHYGLSGPNSAHFERVALGDNGRPGGLLGHASVHLSGSDGADSNPIKRAVWIRERLLHDPPKPPPPDVPDLATSVPNFAKLSLREQLEMHRKKPACNDCHRSIDPWGIALEGFDAIGMARMKTARSKKPVSTETVLPGGFPIDGVSDLQAHLLSERREQFAHALVANMLTYALGRSVGLDDEPLIGRLVAEFAEEGYRMSALMEVIVTSDSFMSR
ncbi:MAG: hypothetical protein ACI8W8_003204 [Rhodothermales bacterium]|jgi:hypothetical protein